MTRAIDFHSERMCIVMCNLLSVQLRDPSGEQTIKHVTVKWAGSIRSSQFSGTARGRILANHNRPS